MRSLDAITTGLELAGLVSLAVAVGVLVLPFTVPGAVAAFGLCLLATSALVSVSAKRKAGKP